MSRPRRLPPLRLARIGGWTVMGTAGVAALLARLPGAAGTVAPVPALSPPAEGIEVSTTGPALPALPAGGILVLRIGPVGGAPMPSAVPPAAPAASPTTVPQPAAAPEPVPAPPPVTSSGS